jgi:hypothetical protein
MLILNFNMGIKNAHHALNDFKPMLSILLKVLSSHLNRRTRLDSFDPLLKTGGPAIF